MHRTLHRERLPPPPLRAEPVLECFSRGGGLGWGCLGFSEQTNIASICLMAAPAPRGSLRSHPTLTLPYCRRGGDGLLR
jgi:hypothetical protein